MNDTLSASAIASAVAREAAQRITRKVIADLQRIKDSLSGDDSGLKTAWDEICVQAQSDESVFWDDYDQTVRARVGAYVTKLPKHEREALWLETDAGYAWDLRDADDREAYPVNVDDIVDYLVQEHVYARASDWSNARIRTYIERQEWGE